MIVNGIEYVLHGDIDNPNGLVIVEKATLSIVVNPSDELVRQANLEFTRYANKPEFKG